MLIGYWKLSNPQNFGFWNKKFSARKWRETDILHSQNIYFCWFGWQLVYTLGLTHTSRLFPVVLCLPLCSLSPVPISLEVCRGFCVSSLCIAYTHTSSCSHDTVFLPGTVCLYSCLPLWYSKSVRLCECNISSKSENYRTAQIGGKASDGGAQQKLHAFLYPLNT